MSAASEAGGAVIHDRMLASLEEWVYLTEIYGLGDDDARRRLGEGRPGGYLSERTMWRYKAALAEHPEVRLKILRIYTDGVGDE